MSFQDELNRINKTTDRTIKDCLNMLAEQDDLSLDSTTAANTYCETTGLSIQEAFNTKVENVIAPVKQVATITIGGTAETGDFFTVNLPGVEVGYEVVEADDTTAKIATKINTAIQASSGYADQNFTSAVDGAVITLTSKQGGKPFIVSTTTLNVDEGTDDQTAVYEVTVANVNPVGGNLSKCDAAKLIATPE
jgi:hypothetical protein